MNTPPIKAVSLVCLLAACSNPAGPDDKAACTNLEVEYTRRGGWTDTAVLHLDSTGAVRAARLAHASPGRTDGEAHVLVATCDGRSDTVRVYDPEHAAIPAGLAHILSHMEALWLAALYPQD